MKKRKAPLYLGRRRKVKKERTSYTAPASAIARAVTPRSGFPTRSKVKMIYVTKNITMTTGALGAATYQTFRINSIHDFDLTGAGHQPTPHDQLEPIFEEYCVTRVSYKIGFSNASTTNRQLVGVYSSDREETSTNPEVPMEQGVVQWGMLSVSTAGYPNKMLSGTIDIPKLMGKTYAEYVTTREYITTFGSNPADVAYLHVFASDISSGGSTTISLVCEFVLDVVLFGTKLIPQS